MDDVETPAKTIENPNLLMQSRELELKLP